MKTIQTEKENIIKYNKPIKDLKDCKETIKLLSKEKSNGDDYIKLANDFSYYNQIKAYENRDKYEDKKGYNDVDNFWFYLYLKSLGKEKEYIFLIDGNNVKVEVSDIFNPFIKLNLEDGTEVEVIDPKWHMMISYYAYKDATYYHPNNEFASKIIEMKKHPSEGIGGFLCPSLKSWMQEAFK